MYPKCSGPHELNSCSSEKTTCNNYIFANIHYKKYYDTNHETKNPNCLELLIFIRELDSNIDILVLTVTGKIIDKKFINLMVYYNILFKRWSNNIYKTKVIYFS